MKQKHSVIALVTLLLGVGTASAQDNSGDGASALGRMLGGVLSGMQPGQAAPDAAAALQQQLIAQPQVVVVQEPVLEPLRVGESPRDYEFRRREYELRHRQWAERHAMELRRDELHRENIDRREVLHREELRNVRADERSRQLQRQELRPEQGRVALVGANRPATPAEARPGFAPTQALAQLHQPPAAAKAPAQKGSPAAPAKKQP